MLKTRSGWKWRVGFHPGVKSAVAHYFDCSGNAMCSGGHSAGASASDADPERYCGQCLYAVSQGRSTSRTTERMATRK